ncbi:peptide deformylase, partial [Wolbachia pipientis]|uniref:peptide deformylase n=1 Tax=Wolbachia pipientis TaxID=955 RepID=UPI0009BD3FF0
LVVKNIVKNMHISIEKCGIGLAHNQYPKQDGATNPYSIFIIDGQDYYSDVLFEAFINPLIVGYSSEKVGFYHGCLSAIGIGPAKVSTYKEILIAFFSEDLTLQVKKYTGMAAIICQHEFNHLATRGTYVDTVNSYINGDRYIHAEESYLDREEMERDELGKIIEHVVDDIPCLISDETLAKCRKFLINNKLYNDALKQYLHNHPEDKFLHDNLMALPYTTDTTLYSNET